MLQFDMFGSGSGGRAGLGEDDSELGPGWIGEEQASSFRLDERLGERQPTPSIAGP